MFEISSYYNVLLCLRQTLLYTDIRLPLFDIQISFSPVKLRRKIQEAKEEERVASSLREKKRRRVRSRSDDYMTEKL